MQDESGVLYVRIDADTLAAVRANAQRDGLSLSKWCGAVLRRAIEDGTTVKQEVIATAAA